MNYLTVLAICKKKKKKKSEIVFCFHIKQYIQTLNICNPYKYQTCNNGIYFLTGDLWRLIVSYANKLCGNNSAKTVDLYPFIYSQFKKKRTSCVQVNRDCNEPVLSCKKAAELLFEDLTKDSSQFSEDIT